MEIGKIVTRKLSISNLGVTGLADLTITPPKVLNGPAGETSHVAITIPQPISILGAGQEKQIELRIAVSPLMPARGRFEGDFAVRRGGVDACRAPFAIEVVAEGEGPTALVVLPEKLDLSSARVKLPRPCCGSSSRSRRPARKPSASPAPPLPAQTGPRRRSAGPSSGPTANRSPSPLR